MVRIGIIGCDTSHAVEFTRAFHQSAPGIEFPTQVTAAYPGGSSDMPDSIQRIPQFIEELRSMGVVIVDSMAELLARVDAVLLLSLDGRKHLEQARVVFAQRKPTFIDKPLATSVQEAIAIREAAEQTATPWFSCSPLRVSPNITSLCCDPKLGDVVGCHAYGPCMSEPHHPDMFFYGIHAVEILLTMMGPGCEAVSSTCAPDASVVVGVWKDGRVGTVRGIRAGRQELGALAFGSNGIRKSTGFCEHEFGKSGISTEKGKTGYEPLVAQIAAFFHTGRPPVSADDAITTIAFMEAANESQRQDAALVRLPATR